MTSLETEKIEIEETDEIKTDQIYRDAASPIQPFKFDAKVVRVFDDMIKRSVPGYDTILDMITAIARSYVSEHTHIYDLGCSLGSLSFRLLEDSQLPNCTIHAIDNSPAMIQACTDRYQQHKHLYPSSHKLNIVCADLNDMSLLPSSFMILNFVLQFIKPSLKPQLLQKCYDALTSRGALLLSEKVNFENPTKEVRMQQLHHEYKRVKGYSDNEISQKRTALENVLIPDKVCTLKARLESVGFSEVHVWMQCFNFISLIAIK